MTVTSQGWVTEIEEDTSGFLDEFMKRTGLNPLTDEEAYEEWVSSTEFRKWRAHVRKKFNSRW